MTYSPAIRPFEKAKVSVIIPVKNEVSNLGRCLEALQDWADEIVVVDSQSTDGTIQIAEACGARVVQFHYQGGWPKKRQWALDQLHLRNSWVLLLDADEVVDESLRREITAAVQRPDYDGYYIRLEIVFLGRQLKHGDTSLQKLSLFRRGRGAFERRFAAQDRSMADMEVHEHFVVQGRVGTLKSAIRHENINRLDRYIGKHNEYSNWSARVLLQGTSTELQPCLWGTQAQRRRWLVTKMHSFPGSSVLAFLYCYVFRLGFLDGIPGQIYAAFRAVQVFHTKAKIYEIRHVAEKTPRSDRRNAA